MILSKYRITLACHNKDENSSLVSPFREDLVQASSYDLTLGDDFYLCTEEDRINIEHFGNGKHILKIPPNSICYVITKERLNMPDNLCANISLAFGLIRRGIILTAQPPIDPGYHGRIVAMLQNLSDSDVEIEQGAHILSIVFSVLTDTIAPEDLYKGNYADISLESFCKAAVRRGSIHRLETSMKQIKEETITIKNDAEKAAHKTLERILNAITVIIACLTVLLTLFTVKDMLSGFGGARETAAQETVAMRPASLETAQETVTMRPASLETAQETVAMPAAPAETVPQTEVSGKTAAESEPADGGTP